MTTLLLLVIYLAFVSLGLPDSLLGAAWPVMRLDLGAPVAYAGILSMIIAVCTIISSLLSDRMTRRLGAGKVTAFSVFLTAAALLGFSLAPNFAVLCLLAVPYGLGAGAVDAALNNYVALHFSSRHMSWLHCCWGVGAAISPYIMSHFLLAGKGWAMGYRAVSVLQIILTVILFCSLPLWRRQKSPLQAGAEKIGDAAPAKTLPEILRIPGVKYVLLAFFGYCALESTAGLWASSYLVLTRGVAPETAAQFAAYFYIGITVGRFICGFFAERLQDRNLIRIGLGVLSVGIVLVWLPFAPAAVALIGLVVIGLGCAPVYPSIIHATPANFGAENSQAVIGVQMASAYVGSAFMPPVFGWLAGRISAGLYPYYLLIFAVLMIVMSEALNRRHRRAA